MKDYDELLKKLSLDSSELTDEQVAEASGGYYDNYTSNRGRLRGLIIHAYTLGGEILDKAIELLNKYDEGKISCDECIKQLEALVN